MIISKTPLRVSFFGGGTDLREYYEKYEGAVLSTTINKYIYVVVKAHIDDQIILNHFEKEKALSVDAIQHGIIREALKIAGLTKGVEIISFTDLPHKGTGLGTSSAFAVGLLNALFAYIGRATSPYELAELASRIEIDLLGNPIGKQDQYAAAFGGFKKYTFCKDGTVKVEAVPFEIQSINDHLILFHTGIERQASSILSDQKMKMKQNIEVLHELKALVSFESDPQKMGQFLNLGWEKKKKLSHKIQNSTIEQIYQLGMEAGAYGGKLLGAGGGGYFCFLCPPDKHAALKTALSEFKNLPVEIEQKGSQIVYDQ